MSPQTNRRLRYLGVAAVIVAVLWFLTGLCIGAFHQHHERDDKLLVLDAYEVLGQLVARIEASGTNDLHRQAKAKVIEMIPRMKELEATAKRADEHPVSFVAAYRHKRARRAVAELHDDVKELQLAVEAGSK